MFKLAPMLYKRNPQAYTHGLVPYRQGKWAEARKYFQAAIAEKAGHAQSHFKLGMCYFKEDDLASAKKEISKAIELDPKRLEWNKQLSRVQQKLKASSRKKIEPALFEKPNNSKIVSLAQSMVLRKDYDAFEAFYNNVKSYGESPLAFGDAAGERLYLEFLLIHALEDIDVRADKFEEASYYVAKKLLFQSRFSEAEEIFGRCFYNKIAYPESGFLLLLCLLNQGKMDEALLVLKQCLGTTRRAMLWVYYSYFLSCNDQNLYDFSNLLDSWLSVSPKSIYHPDVSKYVALCYLWAGNTKQAKIVWHDLIDKVFGSGKQYSFPDKIRYSQNLSAPMWVRGFEDVPRKYIDDISARALAALVEIGGLASEQQVKLYPVNQTKAWIEKGCVVPLYSEFVEVVVAEDDLTRLITDLSSVQIIVVQYPNKNIGLSEVKLKHINGVCLRVLTFDVGYRVIDHGVSFAFNPFAEVTRTTVIDNSQFELVDAGEQKYGNLYDLEQWVGAAKVAEVKFLDAAICYCYELLFFSKATDNLRLEGVVCSLLRDLGEGKEDYQKVLKGSFNLATESQLKDLNIQVVLYVTGLDDVAYQGNMWIPVLERLNVNSAIVIREKNVAAGLIESDIPVFYMKTMRDLELLDNGIVKTILYPANTQKNVQTLRFHKINHYFINHGESDKVVNQSKFLMAYDKLLVAGPLAERRLKMAGLPIRDGQVVHVGRPQVEISLTRVAHPTSNIKTILYAPTWEGFVEEANYSSVNLFGLSMLKALCDIEGVKVFFKPHPYTGYNKSGSCAEILERMKAVIAQSQCAEFVSASENIHDYMNKSDLLITDISSVLNDYLYTLKPIVLTNTKSIAMEDFHESFPSSKAAYLYSPGEDIRALLAEITAHDSMFKARKEVCEDCLGKIEISALQKFNAVVCG